MCAEEISPIFNFNEFVGQTANKLKDYFIQNILPVNDGTINWTEVIDNAIRESNIEDRNDVRSRALAAVSELTGDPLSQVVQANQIFKEEQAACNAELKSLQGAIDSLIFYDDYTGPTNIEALDNQIRELSLLKDSVIAYRSAEMQTASISAKLSVAQKDLDELKAIGGIEVFEQGMKNMTEACEDISNKMQATKDEIMEMSAKAGGLRFIINNGGRCQYNGEVCSSISDKIPEFETQLKEFGVKHSKLKSDLENYKAEYELNHIGFENARNNINKWNELNSQITNLQSMVSTLPTKPNTDKTDIELAQEIKVLQDNKMKAFANQQYNATIDELTKKKFQLELDLVVYKALVKTTDVNGLQTQVMQQPFNKLAYKMTMYIQAMYGDDSLKAHFNVECKANSFSFGLIRDGKYIPYDLLSSGEKCLYALNLMLCIVDNSKSPLRVLMLDDALDNLDDIAIENTFRSLKNIVGIQFILAGVKHCDNASDVIVEVS